MKHCIQIPQKPAAIAARTVMRVFSMPDALLIRILPPLSNGDRLQPLLEVVFRKGIVLQAGVEEVEIVLVFPGVAALPLVAEVVFLVAVEFVLAGKRYPLWAGR